MGIEALPCRPLRLCSFRSAVFIRPCPLRSRSAVLMWPRRSCSLRAVLRVCSPFALAPRCWGRLSAVLLARDAVLLRFISCALFWPLAFAEPFWAIAGCLVPLAFMAAAPPALVSILAPFAGPVWACCSMPAPAVGLAVWACVLLGPLTLVEPVLPCGFCWAEAALTPATSARAATPASNIFCFFLIKLSSLDRVLRAARG